MLKTINTAVFSNINTPQYFQNNLFSYKNITKKHSGN